MNRNKQGCNQLPDAIKIHLIPIAIVLDEFDELCLGRIRTFDNAEVL